MDAGLRIRLRLSDCPELSELVGLPVAVCLQLARLKPMGPVCRVSDAQIGVLSSASIAVTGTPNPSFFAPPSYLPLW
jgi:hypothetical protein